MTQTDIPTQTLTFQFQLMAALQAIWRRIEGGSNPAELRQARDQARAIGDLAAMARRVALMPPRDRARPGAAATTDHAAASLHALEGVAKVQAMLAESTAAHAPQPPAASVAAPVAAQVEPARRALDKLKGGRRGRL